MIEWYNELVLEKSSRTIHAVPVEDRVEWVEERLVVSEGVNRSTQLLVVVQGVEASHEIRVEKP